MNLVTLIKSELICIYNHKVKLVTVNVHLAIKRLMICVLSVTGNVFIVIHKYVPNAYQIDLEKNVQPIKDITKLKILKKKINVITLALLVNRN